MKHIIMSGPHSHSSRARFTRAMESAGIEHKLVRFTLGMRGLGWIIPDTPEAIATARANGATVSRIQWAHLQRDES